MNNITKSKNNTNNNGIVCIFLLIKILLLQIIIIVVIIIYYNNYNIQIYHNDVIIIIHFYYYYQSVYPCVSSRVDWEDCSVPGGRSLSMPLSLDMTEKRVVSDGAGSLGQSPSSKSSWSWLRENCSDDELARNHLESSRPVRREKAFNSHAIGDEIPNVAVFRCLHAWST